MKPEFNIGARNGLLEDKHLTALGSAIWLYLWFIDRQPKSTPKVLGGKPITYELVGQTYFSLSRRTYERWLCACRKGGYIETLRTPYGLVVTITKAKKWDMPKMAHQTQRDVSKVAGGYAKNGGSRDKNGTSNKTIQLDNTKTIQLRANNQGSEITQLIKHFEDRIGKMAREAHQSFAAAELIKQHGFEKSIGAVNAVAASRSAQYAPSIASLEDLRDKWIKLETFYQRAVVSKQPKGVKIN